MLPLSFRLRPNFAARRVSAIGTVALLASFSLHAEPENEVREAVSALARTSYTWETTVRQQFRGDNATPRIDPKAPIELRGKADANGFIQMSWGPTRELTVPITAVFRSGEAVAHTPSGWLRRGEIRQAGGGDRTVEFEGKQVRLSRVLNAALTVTAMRPLTEDLFDLVADVKAYRVENGLILGELSERGIERLWRDPQARRAPEVQGTIIFKLREQTLAEVHVMLAIGFPNSRTNTTAWSMQQSGTRITDVGTTVVEPPAAAVQALEKD